MYSNPAGRKSFESLASPTSPHTNRADYPFHRNVSVSNSTRRGSTASSIHSVGGALDSAGTWTWPGVVLESGQNAISTLLQPPIVRTGLQPHMIAPASSAHKPPTTKDIPPVTLTNIKRIDPAEFKPYLSQVGALYEQLRRAKESEDEASDLQSRRGSKNDEVGEPYEEGRLRPGRRSRKTSVSSVSSFTSIAEAPNLVRRSSSSYARRSAQGPPPLSTIPTVYFDDDFHLENPRTFDIVSERSEVVRPPPGTIEEDKVSSNGNGTAPRKALATNAILQEKLSWYMDTIEMHLISSISTASTTFFTALGSLKELHTEAAESVDRIKALRQELEALDHEIATSGLEVIQKRRRRENVQQLHDAVLQLKEIVDQLATCESLVEAGEVEKALDSIDLLENLIAGEEAELRRLGSPLRNIHLRDLRGATALQGVSDDMSTLRSRIGKAYETKFVNSLMADLRRHINEMQDGEVLQRWSSASARARGVRAREPSVFPSYLGSTEDLRKDLTGSLAGLWRAKHITVAVTTYRESILRELRNLIRNEMPASNDDDNESMMSSSTMTGGKQLSQQEKSSILARNLRNYGPEDAEKLLVKIYVHVTETLRRMTTQVKLLLDVASSIEDGSIPSGMKSPPLKSAPFSPGRERSSSIAGMQAHQEIHKVLDLSNLLGTSVDVAQDKIVKVLRVRSEQSTHLALIWFLRYFTLNLHFANECESISGRSGTTLKNVVNGHIKDFVQLQSDAEKQKLAQGMESDKWDARDFTRKDTIQLDRILHCSTEDSRDWTEGTQIWIPYPSEEDAEVNGIDDVPQTNGGGKAKTREAVIDSEKFFLPNSAVICMEGMSNFLHLTVGIPSRAETIARELVTYLQVFNSRCTQLILGAGATRSAGLKNITTKHLALASQALAFMAMLIPHVREFVRRHAGSGDKVSALMGEFDKVKREIQEHQNQIYDKLVEIMSGRAASHVKTMKAIDFHKDKKSPHGYMETLTKETTTLHRNLAKTLPEGTVKFIMIRVFTSYKDQFGKAFEEVGPKTEAGRDSMLSDIEYLGTKLGKIDGFGDTGDHLTKIIKSKKVTSSAPAPVPAPAAPASTTTSEAKNSEESEKPTVTTESKKPEKENGEGQAKEPADSEAKK